MKLVAVIKAPAVIYMIQADLGLALWPLSKALAMQPIDLSDLIQNKNTK